MPPPPMLHVYPNTAYVLLKVRSKVNLAEFITSSGGQVKSSKLGKTVTHIITSQVVSCSRYVVVHK